MCFAVDAVVERVRGQTAGHAANAGDEFLVLDAADKLESSSMSKTIIPFPDALSICAPSGVAR